MGNEVAIYKLINRKKEVYNQIIQELYKNIPNDITQLNDDLIKDVFSKCVPLMGQLNALKYSIDYLNKIG